MEKKITFIIPSVNRPSLSRTIDSLINQTNSDWECIIVFDDVESPPEFDNKRIRTMNVKKEKDHEKSKGRSGLIRNYALKECNTRWIGFVDDDDTIHPRYVEDLMSKYFSYDFLIWRMKYTHGLILPELHEKEIKESHVGISFCYKNKFKNLIFNDYGYHVDFYFLKKLQERTKKFIITPEIYYNVRH